MKTIYKWVKMAVAAPSSEGRGITRARGDWYLNLQIL